MWNASDGAGLSERFSGVVGSQAASISLIIARGGVGMHPSPLGRDKIGTMREGFLRALPFSLPFVHLHRAGKAAYLG